ncbi:MAG TPA: hypothetical protein ENI55_06545 [Alphaproteobacteria bacterium]|nr:hypothetical protein [Alphaproteobacteria bacterium]
MAGFNPMIALSVLQAGQGLIKSARAAGAYKNANAALAGRRQAELRQRRQMQEIDARSRRERLRQAMAAQRARFGAQGVSASSGSAGAVLRGLSERSNRAGQDANKLEAFRVGGINERYNMQRRRNLLEASGARKRLAFDLLRQGMRTIPLIKL